MKKIINFFLNLFIYAIIFAIFIFIILSIFNFLFNTSNKQIDIQSIVTQFKDNTITNTIKQSNSKNIIDISTNNSGNTIIASITNTENINGNNNIQTNTNFYYLQLNENAKIIYDALEENINNLIEENYTIDFSTTFNTLLNKSDGQYQLNKAFQSALDAFFYDHPELFYIDLTKMSLLIKSSSFLSNTTYSVSITPRDEKNYISDYLGNTKNAKEAVSKVENIKNNIINYIDTNNDYDTILQVHNILINSIKYDTTTSNAHNIYGALVENISVCEGYAKAFKYILDSLNIKCILVNGIATNSSGESESHMWNYIKLNDKWYGVDVTWDDPITIGNPTRNNLRHDYFLKGYYTFSTSHSPSGKISDEGILFKIPTLSFENYTK